MKTIKQVLHLQQLNLLDLHLEILANLNALMTDKHSFTQNWFEKLIASAGLKSKKRLRWNQQRLNCIPLDNRVAL